MYGALHRLWWAYALVCVALILFAFSAVLIEDTSLFVLFFAATVAAGCLGYLVCDMVASIAADERAEVARSIGHHAAGSVTEIGPGGVRHPITTRPEYEPARPLRQDPHYDPFRAR